MDTFVRDPFGRDLSIAAGASRTDPQHVGPREFGSVRVPSTWPADTDLVFETCDTKSGTYVLACDENGAAHRIKNILPGVSRAYSVPEGAMRRSLPFVRLVAVAAGSVADALLAADQTVHLSIR